MTLVIVQHISDEKKSYAEDINSLCLCRQLRTDPQRRKLFQTHLILFRCVLAAVKPSSMYPCRVVLSLAVMSGITSLIGRYSGQQVQSDLNATVMSRISLIGMYSQTP